MTFLYMSVHSFSFCVIFCLSLIFSRKCWQKFKIEVDLVIKGDGHRGTTNEFATIHFHLVLFSPPLAGLTNSIPAHSLILSSHLFLCLPLLFPFIVPCRIVFAKPADFEMWPNCNAYGIIDNLQIYNVAL